MSGMNEIKYKNLFSLVGKVAIVTGGAGVLGRQFCAGLSEAGANVVVVDVDENRVFAQAKDLVKRYGTRSIGIKCDVSSPESVNEMVSRVVAELGEIHILHNNAATKTADPNDFFTSFEEYSLDVWRKVMSVNIDGMFLVAQSVGAQMIRQGKGGSIIQTSSIYGIMGPDHRVYKDSLCVDRAINTPAVYSASKAAVIGLTKYLAAYWAEKDIRVNTLTPGGVKNDQDKEFIKRYSARVPLGRMASSDELVGALLYLASDASKYMTGQNLIIDGGLDVW
jgi:NAD(P)-dependent dehydrogenase (short-subunit alcohol dehydrogenase family)